MPMPVTHARRACRLWRALALPALLLSLAAQAGSGTIDACWNQKTGTLNVIKAKGKCAKTETKITIAAQGAKVAGAPTSFGLGRIVGRLQTACSVEHPGDPVLDSPQGFTVFVPGRAYLLETGIDGAFQFDLVQPGRYQMVASKSGRATFDIGTIKVIAGKTTSVPTVLAPCTVLCGDGNITGNEQCDDKNTTAGDGCSATCQVENVCGNATIEAGESCDGANLNGSNCTTLGFADGTLSCTASCQLDSTACVGSPP